jgi:hypothetical protein
MHPRSCSLPSCVDNPMLKLHVYHSSNPISTGCISPMPAPNLISTTAFLFLFLSRCFNRMDGCSGPFARSLVFERLANL